MACQVQRANKDVTAARAREDIRKGFGGIAMPVVRCPTIQKKSVRDLVNPTSKNRKQGLPESEPKQRLERVQLIRC